MKQLEEVLQSLNVPIDKVSTVEAAVQKLSDDSPPDVIFVELRLAHGRWTEMVRLARESANATAAIVVSPVDDVPLYLDALDYGAFDFLAPPFNLPHIAALLHQALRQTTDWRRTQFADVLRKVHAAS